MITTTVEGETGRLTHGAPAGLFEPRRHLPALPYDFDTSLSDEQWATIICDCGAGRFCLTCIVGAAVVSGESFDVELYGGRFTIRVAVGSTS